MVSASKLAAEISSVFAKLVVPSDQRSKLYLPFADTVTSANGFTDLVSRTWYPFSTYVTVKIVRTSTTAPFTVH